MEFVNCKSIAYSRFAKNAYKGLLNEFSTTSCYSASFPNGVFLQRKDYQIPIAFSIFPRFSPFFFK